MCFVHRYHRYFIVLSKGNKTLNKITIHKDNYFDAKGKVGITDIEIPYDTLVSSVVTFVVIPFGAGYLTNKFLVKEKGLDVILPTAKEIEKIPRKHATTIYVNRGGTITIDDYAVEIPQVSVIMQQKLAEDINTITCFRTDKDTSYGIMSDVLNQLKEANALRVQFEAKLKR
jgi:biopolymer transport protein ExbD